MANSVKSAPHTRSRKAVLAAFVGIFAVLASMVLPGGRAHAADPNANLTLNDAEMFYPGSGILFKHKGLTYRFAALKAPKGPGVNPNIPAWCVDADKPAPGPDAVVQVSSLKQTHNFDEGLHVSTAEMAIILDKYQMSRDANTLGALAYLVHMNMEQSKDPAGNARQLREAMQGSAPNIDQLARQLAQEGRSQAVHSYEVIQPQGDKEYTGEFHNIGLKNAQGAWIPGRQIHLTIEGPAVFTSTGTNKWNGVSQAQPITLGWRASGNGVGKVKQSYEQTPDEVRFMIDPTGKKQSTIQPLLHKDPKFENVDSPSWRVQYDFQPAGVSHVNKLTDTGKFTDMFDAKADPNYGNGKWAKDFTTGAYIPVVYTVSAYYVGENPPARANTVPQGAELIGSQKVTAHGPGKLSADFTAPKEGFVTVVWSVDKANQDPSVTDRIAGNWADDYGIPEETTSNRFPGDVDSTLSIRTTKSGTYLVDDVWITGLPTNHGEFKGDGRFGADTTHIQQALLFFPEGLEVTEENKGKAETIASVEIPAKNGFYPSVGATQFKMKQDKEGLVPGTYVFVSTFKGDDRVKPFVSPVTDKTEQYTITRTPGVRTTLMYEKQKTVPGYGKRILTDKVCYTNVKPGKEYTVEGTLMDKATGKPLVDAQGKKVTASKTLTPKEANGCVDVEFTVDASLFAGKTTVAFEKLLHEGKEVAVHADINDENQTISFEPPPTLKTTATNTNGGGKTVKPEPNQSITDKVCMVNGAKFKPGKTYTIITALMKGDGTPLMNNGQSVVKTSEFTPKSADECAEITIPFDATGLEGQKVVVFEDVKDGNDIVSVHHDIKDTEQTVTVEGKPTPPPLAHTGVTGVVAGIATAGGLLGAGVALKARSRRKTTDDVAEDDTAVVVKD